MSVGLAGATTTLEVAGWLNAFFLQWRPPHFLFFLSSSPLQRVKLEALLEMASNGSGKQEKETNMDVDYVISFRFASAGEFLCSSEGMRRVGN